MQNNKDFNIKKYAALAMLNIDEKCANTLNDDMHALLDVAKDVLSFGATECENKSKETAFSSLREDFTYKKYKKDTLLSCASETEGEYISVSAKAVASSKDGKGGGLNAIQK